nr:MAG TPA: hypothetical protein [Caudoviricetes sp.]
MTIMKYKKGGTRRGCLPFVRPEGILQMSAVFLWGEV